MAKMRTEKKEMPETISRNYVAQMACLGVCARAVFVLGQQTELIESNIIYP